MPNVTERPISGGIPAAPQPVVPAPPVVPAEAKPAAPVDGVDAPRPAAPGPEAAASPRKTIGQRLGALARGALKGAAIVGLAASLIVGGNFVLSRMNGGGLPPPPATPIEAPVEIHTPTLPGGQGPPASEVVAPTGSGAGGQVHGPTLPTQGTGASMPGAPTGPTLTIDSVRVDGPITFTPHSIRVPR